MEENKILYSDASYDHATKIASVSVYDSQKDDFDTKVYKNIKNNFIAEEMALKTSIMLSISRGYKNVVFIYDSMNLDSDKLKLEYEHFFDKIQFLWLKRKFLKKVDSCAKEALRACFATKRKNEKEANDGKILFGTNDLKKLRSESIENLFSFFEKNVLNADEVEILKNITLKSKAKTSLNKIIDVSGLRALNSMIGDARASKEFYSKIKKQYPNIEENKDFRLKMSSKDIINKINNKL